MKRPNELMVELSALRVEWRAMFEPKKGLVYFTDALGSPTT
jgi:hypothetical protein